MVSPTPTRQHSGGGGKGDTQAFLFPTRWLSPRQAVQARAAGCLLLAIGRWWLAGLPRWWCAGVPTLHGVHRGWGGNLRTYSPMCKKKSPKPRYSPPHILRGVAHLYWLLRLEVAPTRILMHFFLFCRPLTCVFWRLPEWFRGGPGVARIGSQGRRSFLRCL